MRYSIGSPSGARRTTWTSLPGTSPSSMSRRAVAGSPVRRTMTPESPGASRSSGRSAGSVPGPDRPPDDPVKSAAYAEGSTVYPMMVMTMMKTIIAMAIQVNIGLR